MINTESDVNRLYTIIGNFQIPGVVQNIHVFGNGLINKTLRIEIFEDGVIRKYILQKINSDIFKDIAGMMDNIERVTNHIRQKSILSGGDPKRETLSIVSTREGKNFLETNGEFYRMYTCIECTKSFDLPENLESLELTGNAFGKFHQYLMDFDSSSIIESIPNFHNTTLRFKTFLELLRMDSFGRATQARADIETVSNKSKYAFQIVKKIVSGDLPVRVIHNDPKFNNVMFDETNMNPVAVVDLDTVMPGPIAYDFGDAVRSACNTCDENEKNLSKVKIDIEKFEAFTRGYLASMRGCITREEIDSLVDGCMTITYELGLRFLTDHINGDQYFKTQYVGQNLEKARVQFALLESMEQNREKMCSIVEKYSKAENEKE